MRCYLCGNSKKPFFKFPTSARQRKKWLNELEEYYIVDNLTEKDVLCSKHFPESSIYSGKEGDSLNKLGIPVVTGNEITPKSKARRKAEVENTNDTMKSKEDKSEISIFQDSESDEFLELIDDKTSNDKNTTNATNETTDASSDTISAAEEEKIEIKLFNPQDDDDDDEEETIQYMLERRFSFLQEQVPLRLTAEQHVTAMDMICTESDFKKATKKIKVHCTVCDKHLGTAPVAQVDRYIHPILNTLLCEQCYHFYNTGEFTKDEDGSEMYCKWCAQGGTVMCCSSCELVFCKDCVLRNLGPDVLNLIECADAWDCFRCKPNQLSKFHCMATALHEYSLKQMALAAAKNHKERLLRDISMCCKPEKKRTASTDEDEEELPVPKKQRKLQKAPTFLQPSGVVLLNKALNNFTSPTSSATSTNSLSTTTKTTCSSQPTIKIRAIPTALLQDPKSVSQSPPPLKSFLPPTANSTPVRDPLMPQLQQEAQTTTVSSNENSCPPPLIVVPKPVAPPKTSSHTVTKIFSKSSISDNDVRTIWLKRAMNSSTKGVEKLLDNYRQIDQTIAFISKPTDLAATHNKMQHILSQCTNMLIDVRKKMHHDFIEYLKVANVSHSSIGKNGDSTQTVTTALSPKQAMITSIGGVSVPVTPTSASTIVLKQNPKPFTTVSPGLRVVNKPVVLNRTIRGQQIVVRPPGAGPRYAIRAPGNLVNQTAFRGLRPVMFNAPQARVAGIPVQKGAVILQTLNKGKLPQVVKTLKVNTTLTKVSPPMNKSIVNTMNLTKLKLSTPQITLPQKLREKLIYTSVQKPKPVEKDPLAVSDDEENNSQVQQPIGGIRLSMNLPSLVPLQKKCEDTVSSIQVKIENTIDIDED